MGVLSGGDGNPPADGDPVSPAVPCGPAKKYDVRVLTFNRTGFGAGLPLIDAADGSSATHTFKDRFRNPSADTMRSAMKQTQAGDILSYVLHTVFNSSGVAVGISNTDNTKPSQDDFITVKEGVASLRRCAAAVLCGCDTSQMLGAFLANPGVAVVFGLGIKGNPGLDLSINQDVAMPDAYLACDAITAKLMNEGTIEAARRAGQAAMKSIGTLTGSNVPQQVVVRVRSGVDKNENLRNNDLLSRFPQKP